MSPGRRRHPLLDLLHQREGALTRDLVRRPGGFGLGQLPVRLAPDATTPMICGFCSTGCSLDVHLQQGESVNLSPTTHYPVNLGMACPKGWEALTPLRAPDRATLPLLRDAQGRLQPVSWDKALDAFVGRFKTIQQQHGADAVAFLSTGQIPTEEMALLGAVAKFGMGLVHGDGNTRQCMSTAVVAYKEAFGFDAPPYTYADFESSDVIVLVGSNLCISHPIMWERICRNPHNPEIVVVDPRRTETAVAATQHYALRPKSDLTLLYGVANILITRGWIDSAFIRGHTEGFEEFAHHVSRFSIGRVSAASGLTVEELERLATTIHEGQRVSFWWTMGVNQSHEGVRTAQAIINLALMTGSIGRPGTGANSITGQCNAMGSRLFSNTTNLLGGRPFTSPTARRTVASRLGIDVTRIPDRPGMAYDQIIEAILAGSIKGLWVIATNPAHSWINQPHLTDVLDRLDFLVVQDMYTSTDTALRADLVLPAAGWGEKDGTFINSERRFGVLKKVARAPGEALADFYIFKLVAAAWGCADLFEEWECPEAVFQILKRLSEDQPCDFTGIEGYRMIEERGGIQWPFTRLSRSGEGERRLFEDGRFYHPDGRARFVFEDPRPVREATSSRYPLVLLTGRGSSAQWHTQTRTEKSPMLRTLAPRQAYVEISPGDAADRRIHPNDRVVITSSRASVGARAFVTPTVSPGQVFVPMHYPETNQLTGSSFDPYSRQPSYKHCAVEVRLPGPADQLS
ncbi:MAG: nitrate reductase [Actinobacteria bacterium]|nr:nitrate reductase [Actinomycetota bacterium]